MTAAHLWPPLLLLGSNVLMTFAWYGHLRRPAWPLWLAVVASWSLAFLEYCLAAMACLVAAVAFMVLPNR